MFSIISFMRPRRQIIDGKQECISCHLWLPLEDFHKLNISASGRAWRCKSCTKTHKFNGRTKSQIAMDWNKAHPERTKELARQAQQRVTQSNPARLAKRRAASLRYYHNHKATFTNSRNNWKKNNPWHAVADRSRSIIRMTLLSFGPGGKTFLNLTGCDGNAFRQHIQSLWLPNMSWANFGRGGWNIGHIIPCSHFKLQLLTPEGLHACFHFSNLQPEWEHTNSCKHSKTSLSPAQISLLFKKTSV
jgi:hypothetical protein